eukprot:CAMPEP_0172156350 /NCGR_PEP_ID=MMETSP1050-20130122/3148_1 /TAXON_ID=233186 /ORGANISM="Cryptomonas curvata, Strain CCAP979/52" /LENGTH=272 /DNA_ID=CAMNT_0012825381 /DNA_START=158 /DNA_END=972 /DNA_ORIENTATION=-
MPGEERYCEVADVPAGLKARQSKKRLRGKKPEFEQQLEVEPESAKPFRSQLFVPPLFTTKQWLSLGTKSAVTKFKENVGCFSLTSRFGGPPFDKHGLAQAAVQSHQRTSSFYLSESQRVRSGSAMLAGKGGGLGFGAGRSRSDGSAGGGGEKQAEKKLSSFGELKKQFPEKYPEIMMEFTCSKCETRQRKRFTRHAYEKGIVIVRCEGCEALHLIADNIGWYKDWLGQAVNVEQVLAAKGEKVENRLSRRADGTLEVALDDLLPTSPAPPPA